MLFESFNGPHFSSYTVRLSLENKEFKYVEILRLSFIVPETQAFTFLYFLTGCDNSAIYNISKNNKMRSIKERGSVFFANDDTDIGQCLYFLKERKRYICKSVAIKNL